MNGRNNVTQHISLPTTLLLLESAFHHIQVSTKLRVLEQAEQQQGQQAEERMSQLHYGNNLQFQPKLNL
ncbi:hypothetical protein LSH36_1093g00081 [Paralvinella palmiformis]|uniref:Uncharacterized protein n=1 Tax=Paralvinella palmiformis TaxID=53620 RepID=A0AAD9IVQ9_9ANNE|nr:hypothetical protein LSH36_1093g00081 [Paralvinella palmiformis]